MAQRSTITNYAQAGEIVKEMCNMDSDLLDVRFHARFALQKVLKFAAKPHIAGVTHSYGYYAV